MTVITPGRLLKKSLEACFPRGGRALRATENCIFFSAAFALVVFFSAASASAGSRDDSAAASFSIDLDGRYEDVMDAVHQVATDGVIEGTFEYRGDENLPGAELAQNCSLFDPWGGPGKLVCKIRKHALSPSHFINTNDVGTVAVRYIVQSVTTNTTRLFIDAIFLESSHHHPHASDGYVETSEFAEVAKRLKDITEARAAQESGGTNAALESSSRPAPLPSGAAVASDTSDLQKVLAEQEAKLHADSQRLNDLQHKLAELQVGRKIRVSAERTELRTNPYSHSSIVTAVQRGQTLLVLAESEHWYQVRSDDGHEGWIKHAQVEAQP
jgi:hypothetical protein